MDRRDESKVYKLEKTLSELGKLRNVNYEKEFLLMTDASNIGMGAGQRKMVSVRWASKKFTPTEVKHGISEKEMYAMFLAVKKI